MTQIWVTSIAHYIWVLYIAKLLKLKNLGTQKLLIMRYVIKLNSKKTK